MAELQELGGLKYWLGSNSPFLQRPFFMHLVYPPPPPAPPPKKKKIFRTTVFNFSWDDCSTQERFETMVMQNFGGKERA